MKVHIYKGNSVALMKFYLHAYIEKMIYLSILFQSQFLKSWKQLKDLLKMELMATLLMEARKLSWILTVEFSCSVEPPSGTMYVLNSNF